MKRTVVSLALLAALLGCSKEKPADEPSELVDIQPTVRIERVWSSGVGGGEETLRLGLGLAAEGERVFAAGHDGDVAAFDAKTGRVLWRTRTKAPLAGGTGAAGDWVAVGSSDGEVIALASADGAIKWRVKLPGEVLSAPAVAPNSIIVRTVDGKLRALALTDGRELWITEQQIPRLTLRGTAAPVIARDVAIAGFDNGKVMAVALEDGSTVWETTVAPSRGRTELERLVDIDAAVKVVGDDVFVVSFQGRAAMLALDSGQIWWTRDLSSYRGADIDEDSMYIATSEGALVSLKRRTGVEQWRQESLKHRGLSAPVVVGNMVAVADFAGYVHWFDKATGEPAGRTGGAGGRVSNTPLSLGDTLYLVSDGGRVSAMRARELAARRAPVAPSNPVETAPEPAATAEPAVPPLPSTEPPTG
jgi:outer membrane protein assembly factor BamB